MVTKTPITGKKQLTERIAKKTKTPQNQVVRIIDELLEETKKALIKGEEVRLLGYFSFKTTMTTPRLAMNLQTGKKMKVPAKRVPKSTINQKKELLDRNRNNYLILELDNGEKGQEINFTVEEGKNGANVLVDYEIEEIDSKVFISELFQNLKLTCQEAELEELLERDHFHVVNNSYVKGKIENLLTKLKEGVIKLGKLGDLHKKKRIMRSALNGKTYVYYQKYLLKQQDAGTGIIGAGFSYNQDLGTEAVTFGLAGGALAYASDYGIKKLEEKTKNLAEKLSSREDEFQQKSQELKDNYNKLIKI
ncbi:2006_t:CDS:2 [Ambispora gerdemannii]|uniref:2006_t:CDS:1 n=1 Tax=Ambispora gerdemannii TaxID=144530 RepID=A0A9N8VP21_9GLOM|nr:2006_t:CDS:2 [Ambispora gerdemannii]